MVAEMIQTSAGSGRVRAEAADGLVLEDLEELGLQGLGEEGDLVEEEDAAVGGLEEAGLGAAGIGEGAALEAEELGFEQGVGDGGAVDVDEGAVVAGAGVVDEAGDQALAGAGLAVEEDGGEAAAGSRRAASRARSGRAAPPWPGSRPAIQPVRP